jgi:hypothetical protein
LSSNERSRYLDAMRKADAGDLGSMGVNSSLGQ